MCMASGHGLSGSSLSRNYLANLPSFRNENEPSSTQASNLIADKSGYLWKGNLSELKCFVQDVLKLTGKWSSPGGETKLFKGTDVILKWFGPTRMRLVVEKDSERNFLANTLLSLYTKKDVVCATPTVEVELASLKLELSTIWALLNGMQDTMMVKLDEVTSVYENELETMKTKLNKVTSEYENKFEILNAKLDEVTLEHGSIERALESEQNAWLKPMGKHVFSARGW